MSVTNLVGLGVPSQAANEIANMTGSNDGLRGTVTLNGATNVVVNNANIGVTDIVLFSLNTVGGTVGANPSVKVITPGTSFAVAGTASDTSVYNYRISKI